MCGSGQSRRRLANLLALTGILILAWAALARPVQAQDWSKIDCSQSRVTSAPMTTCWEGPVKAASADTGICYFEQYSAFATSDMQYNYVRLFILNKHKSPPCGVAVDPHWTDSLKGITLRVQNQSWNWSEIIQIAGVSGMRFDLPDRRCFALYRIGPGAGHGGVLYALRGLVCGAVGRSALTDNQIATFLSSIRVTEP